MATTPAKRSKKANLSQDELDRVVAEIVRFLVVSESKKSITSRTDISKAVLQEKQLGSAVGTLLEPATKMLRDLFGWDLVTVPTFSSKGKKEGMSKTDMMVRRSPELERFMAPIQNELPAAPDMGFIMIVLSILMMHNFSIEENNLFLYLTKFGIEKNEKQAMFGDKPTVELIKDLVKHNYIAMTRSKEGGNTSVEVTIGTRSLLEIGKVNILRFVNGICATPLDMATLREFTAEQKDYMEHAASGRPDVEDKAPAKRKDQEAVEVDDAEEEAEQPKSRRKGAKRSQATVVEEEVEEEAPQPRRRKQPRVQEAEEEEEAPQPRRKKQAPPPVEDDEEEEVQPRARRKGRPSQAPVEDDGEEAEEEAPRRPRLKATASTLARRNSRGANS